MNKIYLLSKNPEIPSEIDPWKPWYDKCFAMVVIAGSEQEAREMASKACQDEGSIAWLENHYSVCRELKRTDKKEIVVQDVWEA